MTSVRIAIRYRPTVVVINQVKHVHFKYYLCGSYSGIVLFILYCLFVSVSSVHPNKYDNNPYNAKHHYRHFNLFY